MKFGNIMLYVSTYATHQPANVMRIALSDDVFVHSTSTSSCT